MRPTTPPATAWPTGARIQYRDWAARKRKTEELADELEARHALVRKGELEPPRKRLNNTPIDTVLKEFLAYGDAQGGRDGRPWGAVHSRNRRAQMNWWIEHLRPAVIGDLEGCLLDVERCLRELQQQGKAPRTVAQYSETIGHFCAWCAEREYFKESPLKRLGLPNRAAQVTRRAMSLEEVQRLLDVAWTKNREAGFQPLPPDLVERLLQFQQTCVTQAKLERFYKRRDTQPPPQGRLLYILSNPIKAFYEDLQATGIPKVTPEGKLDFHSLRVAYTTFVIESGANVKEAQTLLRHSNPALTMNIYARHRPERLNQVVARLGDTIQGRREGPAAATAVGDQDAVPPAGASRSQDPAPGGQKSAPSMPPRGGRGVRG